MNAAAVQDHILQPRITSGGTAESDRVGSAQELRAGTKTGRIYSWYEINSSERAKGKASRRNTRYYGV